ncbi:hypothetical protein V5799_003262 [Amblyomma americanum]|uniref:THAP-type domain-containing protein n=1 Tax=Amblyomma americanum TaxID=6943 RepID=A0AAQ4D9G6_AMBAM
MTFHHYRHPADVTPAPTRAPLAAARASLGGRSEQARRPSSIAAAVSSGSLAFCACDYMGPRPNNKNCCVVGCNSKYSNSPGVKFFSFPSRPWERERRQRWIQLVRRQNEDGTGWLPSNNSRICSKHFVGNVKANEVGHPSYHPSIFPSVYKRKQTPGSSRRCERQMEREKKKAAGRYQDPAPHLDSPVLAIDYSAEQANEIAPMECSLSDASTMTEDQPECFTGELIFLSVTSNCTASCFVSHKTSSTVERGTVCDTDFCDKAIGPVHKQPYFELETEMPPGIEKRNLWFSNYKGRYTLKYLIGIAPNGLVTFISEGFGGRTTDAVITTQGKLLSLLEPGDVILADKGFPGIRTGVGAQQATLVMPPFATSPQFTESEVDATYETASVRIHVERVIQRLKIFQILTNRIPHELAGYVDDILHVVAVITNVKPGIFAKNDCSD